MEVNLPDDEWYEAEASFKKHLKYHCMASHCLSSAVYFLIDIKKWGSEFDSQNCKIGYIKRYSLINLSVDM